MREMLCTVMCVCVRYRVREMLCTVICVCEVQGEGNVVYSDVCLRYRVRVMLCTVMCVRGTE